MTRDATPTLNHHLIENENKTLILYLHGFLGCGQDFDETVKALDSRFSHLAVDLPGHGAKPPDFPTKAYQMSSTAQLVINLLDELQIARCHMVTYSMGGRLGLYLLINYPQRFSKAVIESASPGLKTVTERQERRLSDKHVSHRLATQSLGEFLETWYDQPLFHTINQSDPRFKALMNRRLQSDPVGLSLALEQMGTGTQPSLWDSLKTINLPVLFVAGEHDAKYQALAIEMASLCPRGRTAIIQGAGHNVHFERPLEYSAEASNFFGETK